MSANDELDALIAEIEDVEVDWHPPATDMESKGKPAWAHHSCGATWKNREATAHCPTCHLTFTSDSGFEGHRYGTYTEGRKCRSAEWLVANGWTCKPGHLRDGKPTTDLWSMPAPANNPWKDKK